ncbi:ABC transporter permease [Alkalicoccobacillus murimartini]|uniref:ABC-2 type transport system permease protein n=1 Tax=Alkalicoccobacillus murimartini TaxID=171685 RepID=A0ABT9YGV7_9BACI|nr:ABC transporter permease [Alkalicoccobacillus murimartini]MDQ0207097.1 ABC-2 type transport system permease protein [Alkalicoccobacillus murimartini]
MNNFWTVVLHTLSNRLKTKTFIVTTLITIAFIAGAMNIDRIFEAFSGDSEPQTIAVVGNEEDVTNAIVTELSGVEDLDASNESATEGEPADVLQESGADYVLTLSGEDSGQMSALLYAEDVDGSVATEVETTLQRVKESLATLELGLDEAELAQIYSPISFETESAAASLTPDRTEEETFQAQAIVYVLLFVIYLSVILYGTMIATEVATEKSSRVMEILVSSVHPIVQMFGKIIGIAGVALLQVLTIAIGAGIGYLIRGSGTDNGFLSQILGDSLPYDLIIYAFIFLALGFLLYGSIAAMLGSLVSRVEDVNTLIQPLIYMVMIAFFIAIYGLSNPDSMLVTITSWVPFFSPIIMFLRFGLLAIPVWEVVLSFGVMIVSIVVFSLFAANVYKGGVIMYGSGSLIKGIKSALSLSKK